MNLFNMNKKKISKFSGLEIDQEEGTRIRNFLLKTLKRRKLLDIMKEEQIKYITNIDIGVNDRYHDFHNEYLFYHCVVRGWGIISGILDSPILEKDDKDYLLTILKRDLPIAFPELYSSILTYSRILDIFRNHDDYPIKAGEIFSLFVSKNVDIELLMIGSQVYMESRGLVTSSAQLLNETMSIN